MKKHSLLFNFWCAMLLVVFFSTLIVAYIVDKQDDDSQYKAALDLNISDYDSLRRQNIFWGFSYGAWGAVGCGVLLEAGVFLVGARILDVARTDLQSAFTRYPLSGWESFSMPAYKSKLDTQSFTDAMPSLGKSTTYSGSQYSKQKLDYFTVPGGYTAESFSAALNDSLKEKLLLSKRHDISVVRFSGGDDTSWYLATPWKFTLDGRDRWLIYWVDFSPSGTILNWTLNLAVRDETGWTGQNPKIQHIEAYLIDLLSESYRELSDTFKATSTRVERGAVSATFADVKGVTTTPTVTSLSDTPINTIVASPFGQSTSGTSRPSQMTEIEMENDDQYSLERPVIRPSDNR